MLLFRNWALQNQYEFHSSSESLWQLENLLSKYDFTYFLWIFFISHFGKSYGSFERSLFCYQTDLYIFPQLLVIRHVGGRIREAEYNLIIVWCIICKCYNQVTYFLNSKISWEPLTGWLASSNIFSRLALDPSGLITSNDPDTDWNLSVTLTSQNTN